MDDLKPCPFCGGEASHNDGGNSVFGRFWWSVGCLNCGTRLTDQEVWEEVDGRMKLKLPAKECFTRWNTRTTPAVQEAAKVLLDNTPNPTFDILKPILMSEHSVTVPGFDEDGEEYMREITVSWVVMKRIISHALRALSEEPQ